MLCVKPAPEDVVSGIDRLNVSSPDVPDWLTSAVSSLAASQGDDVSVSAAKAAKAAEDTGATGDIGSKPGAGESKENAGVTSNANAAGPAAAAPESKGGDLPSARQLQKNERKTTAAASAKAKSRPSGKIMDHFSHLRQFADEDEGANADSKVRTVLLATAVGGVPPAVARLAAHYADGTITGGRARAEGIIRSASHVVDSSSSSNKGVWRIVDGLIAGGGEARSGERMAPSGHLDCLGAQRGALLL